MVACSRFRGSHRTDSIAMKFDNTITAFGISNKVSHIVTNNAANMIKALSLPVFGKMGLYNSSDESSDDWKVM